jgi:hypothetical protein
LVRQMYFCVLFLIFSSVDALYEAKPITVSGGPGPVTGHSAVNCDGPIILFGGSYPSLNQVYDWLFIFSPDGVAVKANISGPEPRYLHSAMCWNRTMLIYGGLDDHSTPSTVFYSDIWALDTEGKPSLQWKNTTLSCPPLAGHTAVMISESSFLVFGGKYVDNSPSADLYYGDLERSLCNIQHTAGEQPTSRWKHSAVVVNNKMWIFGGDDGSGTFFGDLWCYNIVEQRWYNLSIGGPAARSSHCSIALPDDSGFLLYGGSDAYYFYADLWTFRVGTEVWEQYLLTIQGRSGSSLTAQQKDYGFIALLIGGTKFVSTTNEIVQLNLGMCFQLSNSYFKIRTGNSCIYKQQYFTIGCSAPLYLWRLPRL